HGDAALEAGRVRGEVAQQAQVAAREDADAGVGAGAGADDEVGPAVAVDVPGRDAAAAGEVGGEGEQAGDPVAVCSAGDLYVRPAAGRGGGDVVSLAVAVHVAGRHLDAAAEGGVVGVEALENGAVLAAERLDVRPAAGAGAGDQVGEAVAVDVADGDEDAA